MSEVKDRLGNSIKAFLIEILNIQGNSISGHGEAVYIWCQTLTGIRRNMSRIVHGIEIGENPLKLQV